MKINYRHGTFETNSSSTHSICIASGECKDSFRLVTNEHVTDGVVIEGGQFGWEVEDYWDAYSKASYAITWVRQYSRLKEEHEKMLEKVIKDHTGAKEIKFLCDTESWDNQYHSYIDHQSDDVCEEAFENEELLKQFIFNTNSMLHTDNDNY